MTFLTQDQAVRKIDRKKHALSYVAFIERKKAYDAKVKAFNMQQTALANSQFNSPAPDSPFYHLVALTNRRVSLQKAIDKINAEKDKAEKDKMLDKFEAANPKLLDYHGRRSQRLQGDITLLPEKVVLERIKFIKNRGVNGTKKSEVTVCPRRTPQCNTLRPCYWRKRHYPSCKGYH